MSCFISLIFSRCGFSFGNRIIGRKICFRCLFCFCIRSVCSSSFICCSRSILLSVFVSARLSGCCSVCCGVFGGSWWSSRVFSRRCFAVRCIIGSIWSGFWWWWSSSRRRWIVGVGWSWRIGFVVSIWRS